MFAVAFAIEKSPVTSVTVAKAIREQLDWFIQHLPVPDRFHRTRSKGFYRRKAKGICWFKDSATDRVVLKE